MILDDLAHGTPEKRHLHAVSAAQVGSQKLQNRVDHGPQDSPSTGRPAILTQVQDFGDFRKGA